MATDMLPKYVHDLSNRLDVLTDTVRDVFDTIYVNEEEAMRFLGVGRDFFRRYYKPVCGLKQGNTMTYRKSELLARRERLRSELGGSRAVDSE